MEETKNDFEEIILDDESKDTAQDDVKVETLDPVDDIEVKTEGEEETLSAEELARHATNQTPASPPVAPIPPKEKEKPEENTQPVGDKPVDPATAQLEYIRNTSLQSGIEMYLKENLGVVKSQDDVKQLMAMYHRIKEADLTDFNANAVYSTLKQAGMALFGERIIANQQKAFEVENKKKSITLGGTVPTARQSNSATNSVTLSNKVINQVKESGQDVKAYAKSIKRMLDTGTISEAQYQVYATQEYLS